MPRDTILSAKIQEVISPSLEAMGYGVVQVRLLEGGRRTLQIMAERADGVNMTVDDCAEISHTVSALLDVEDPVSGAYTLEVSSPGIDRPLIKKEDFSKYAGEEAKIETFSPIGNRKRFRGRLHGIEGDNVQIEVDGELFNIPYPEIGTAKLVLTDELIRKHLNESKRIHSN